MMEDTPREMQMVQSYIEDIKQKVEALSHVSRPGEAEKQANDMLNGDVLLAMKEIEKAEQKGHDVTSVRADMLFEQAGIAMAVVFAEAGVAFVNSTGGLADIIISRVKLDAKGNRWTNRGIEWLQESIRLDPDPVAYYNLGLLLTTLNKKDEAVSAFRSAEQGSDTRISISASKEIARLGLTGSSYVAESGGSAGSPSKDEKLWAMLAHLSGIVFGFLGPLVAWLIKKDEMPFVNYQAKEALNFQITVFIALVAAGVLSFVGIGIILYPVVYIGNLVFCIMAGMKANEGVAYQYPVCLRLVK